MKPDLFALGNRRKSTTAIANDSAGRKGGAACER
jgi:hypothetical protein